MENLVISFNQSGTLHHAYFIVGDSSVLLLLNTFLEEQVKIKTRANSDFWHGKFATFTIDNARSLASSQERKAFGENLEVTRDSTKGHNEGKKIFIIETDFITEEAQNALLKVFEEPTAGTHFFIISPQDTLLPTLRSRVQIIEFESSQIKKLESESILALTLAERMVKVKEITEGISDEEKTKQDAITFLNTIEKELYEKGVEKYSKSLAITVAARESLYARGTPIKMVLEHVVLTIQK